MKMTLIVFLALTCLVLAPAALAQTLWFAVHGGLSGYAMDDLNEEIRDLNDASGEEYLDPLEDGAAIGFALGWNAAPRWSFGVGYERLTGRSQYRDEVRAYEFDAQADLYYGFARYRALGDERRGGGLGARVGSLSARGDYVQYMILGTNYSAAVTGSSILTSLYAWGEIALTPSIALDLEAGYRFATLDDIKYDEREPIGVAIMPEKLEYDGYAVRLGLRFTLPDTDAPSRPEDEPAPAPKPRSEMVDPRGAFALGGFGQFGIPLFSYSNDHDAGFGAGGLVEYWLTSRLAVGADGAVQEQGRGRFPDDELVHVMATGKYLLRPDLSSHYLKAGVGTLDYDYGEKGSQSAAAFEVGLGYQWRPRASLGLFGEAMAVTWSVEGNSGPLIEVRAGAMLLLGD